MKHYYNRSQWHARPPKPGHTTPQGPPVEAFLHHSADKNAARIQNIESQVAHMREVQNYHMDAKGWGDIGYQWVIFQAYGNIPGPRAFRGRGSRVVPAAQEGHNTGTLAICVVGDFTKDTLKPATADLIINLLGRYHHLKTLGGHQNVVATTCPGRNIMVHIPDLARAAGLRVYS